MTRLILVRHGQASFHDGDYDRLSDLGERQSAVLADHWAASGVRFDRVFVGPLLRQRQTAEAVAAVFRRRGLPWPEPEELAELAEHQGTEVVDRALPRLAREDEGELGEVARRLESETEATERMRLYFRLYRRVTRLWIEGNWPPPEDDLEAWPAFRSRVEQALGGMLASGDRDSVRVAFTSGGPVAAAAARVLGLSDERTLELSWTVKNASSTRILATSDRLILRRFNEVAYLEREGLVTAI